MLTKNAHRHERLSVMIPPEGGAEGRADDDAHRENALRLALFLDGIGLAQDGLRRRDQAAAAQALHDAPQDELGQRAAEAAHERRQGKDRDRGRVVLAPAEAHLQPRRDRNDDDVGDDVAGADPGRLIDAGTEVPLDVRQCDVDDRDVDDLEQRRRHDGDRDEGAARAELENVRMLPRGDIPATRPVAGGGHRYGHACAT